MASAQAPGQGQCHDTVDTAAPHPIATPMLISMRSFMANMTADACSAAFPTMGMTMVPMNIVDTFHDTAAPSNALTSTSDRTAMPTVMTVRHTERGRVVRGREQTSGSSYHEREENGVEGH